MKTVDADTHIHEPEAMWQYLDPEFQVQRPRVVSFGEDSPFGSTFNACWVIEGRLYPKPAGPGWFAFRTPPVSNAAAETWAAIGAQTLEDVPTRLEEMDGQRVDYQVVFPTLFLAPMADETKLERALCQAYNRYMSRACAQSQGRIYFAATIPWRNADDAVAVVREAKELGAVAVFVPGIMRDRPLADRFFDPLYAELSRLDRRFRQGSLSHLKRRPSETLQGGNIFVTVEADEDIPYVSQFLNDDQLVIGSDYPHMDPSHEKRMVDALHENTRVPEAMRTKILSANALRLYKLPA